MRPRIAIGTCAEMIAPHPPRANFSSKLMRAGVPDSLDRMAPFFPEITLEVARVEDATCQDVIDALKASGSLKPGGEARNVPAGWVIGPALDLDGIVESMVCHTFGDDALAAGLMAPPGAADMTDYAPLLAALLKAEKID